jgi:hypothetical protein
MIKETIRRSEESRSPSMSNSKKSVTTMKKKLSRKDSNKLGMPKRNVELQA